MGGISKELLIFHNMQETSNKKPQKLYVKYHEILLYILEFQMKFKQKFQSEFQFYTKHATNKLYPLIIKRLK